MISRPSQIGALEFAVVGALCTELLSGGCVPRVEGDHKFVATARLEVIEGVASILPAVLCLVEASRDSDVALTSALTSVGSGDGIGWGGVS